MICPLCQSSNTKQYHRDHKREYLQCGECELVFVPKQYHLKPSDERAEYDLHQNNPNDDHYREFLLRVYEPLIQRVAPGSKGLDFGCGPGPTLSVMLQEKGFNMTLFDPFYYPDTGVFNQQYDFITATEVIEHLAKPRYELTRLINVLKPEGILAVMTKRALSYDAFIHWHYKNDPTHIAFYSVKTFEWIASDSGMKLDIIKPDVVFLTK